MRQKPIVSRTKSFVEFKVQLVRPNTKKRNKKYVGNGFPVVRGNYLRPYYSTGYSRKLKPGRWNPPFGKKGINGKWCFSSKFKGNQGVYKVSRPSSIASIASLLGIIPEEYIKSKGNPGDHYNIAGGWTTSAEEFFEFYNVIRSDGSYSHKFNIFDESNKQKFHGLRFPYVKIKPSKEDVYGVTFTADTSAGMVGQQVMSQELNSYTPLNGGYCKGSFVATAVKSVFNEWDAIHSGKYQNLAGIYSVGGRAKMKSIKFGKDALVDTKLSSRPVHVPEMFNVLFDSVYYQWFNKFWNDECKSSSEIFIGHSMTHLGFLRLVLDKKDGMKFELEADWKGFDKTIPCWLIEYAFSIIRSCFPYGDDIDYAFEFMCSNFMYRNVYTPDGQVYLMKGGIPSGNVWTSLIGSVVNWLCWHEIFCCVPCLKDFEPEDFSVCISGDDTKVNSKKEITLSMWEEIREWVSVNLNMELDATYICSAVSESNPHLKAGFLKTVVVNCAPYRKNIDLWGKLLSMGDSAFKNTTELEYALGRLTNVYLPEGKDRYSVAFYWALVSAVDSCCPKTKDKILKAAIEWRLSGNHKLHSPVTFIKSNFSNTDAFFTALDFFESALGGWYEQINFSWKKKEYQQYWEIGKLRFTVSSWLSNNAYGFHSQSDLYTNCILYSTPYSIIHDPPILRG